MLRFGGAPAAGWTCAQSITSRKNCGWIAASASRTVDHGAGGSPSAETRLGLNSVTPTASPGPAAGIGDGVGEAVATAVGVGVGVLAGGTLTSSRPSSTIVATA